MATNGLEAKMDELFGEKAPVKMPENGRKALVQYLPWISLVFGVLQLLAAWWLYDWANKVNSLADYANSISVAFGGDEVVSSTRFSVWVWVGIALLAVDGLLLLAAFPGLKDRKKQGWTLLFYSAIINLVYGVVSVFMDRNGIGSLIWALVGSAIGFWLLFQVRSYYTGAKPVAPVETKV